MFYSCGIIKCISSVHVLTKIIKIALTHENSYGNIRDNLRSAIPTCPFSYRRFTMLSVGKFGRGFHKEVGRDNILKQYSPTRCDYLWLSLRVYIYNYSGNYSFTRTQLIQSHALTRNRGLKVGLYVLYSRWNDPSIYRCTYIFRVQRRAVQA